MIKQFLTILIIVLVSSNSFALDKKIEDALLANNWQQVYNLLIDENKFNEDPIHDFLMVQACFAVDSDLNMNSKGLDDESFKKLENWLEQFISNNQDNLVTKHLQSELYHLTGNYQRAIQYSIEITKEDSLFALAYNTRSNCFISQGKYEYALNALNHLLNYFPNHSKGYLNRGVVYDESHDYANALQDYETAIKLNPKFAMVYYNQGNTHRHTGNNSSALISFSNALDADSQIYIAYYNRGNTYFDSKDFEQATNDYSKFLDLAPDELAHFKSAVKQKLEYIEKYDKNFDKDKISKIINDAYNAWIKQDWQKFISYIHPQALLKYKESLLPMYEEIYKKNGDVNYITIYDEIISLQHLKESEITFFYIDSKLKTSNQNPDQNKYLPKKMTIKNLEKYGAEIISANISTTYIDGKKRNEELALMLDGTEWKLLLPAPYMRVMVAMIEHYKK